MQQIKKQLWGRKYIHTLGQFFHLALNIKEYFQIPSCKDYQST
jgi:hypothetical protein